MAQPFYARKIDLNIGPRKGETVYSAQAYYYGTITTKQVATQIAQESALTPADVIGSRTSRLFLPNPHGAWLQDQAGRIGHLLQRVAHREKRKHTQGGDSQAGEKYPTSV